MCANNLKINYNNKIYKPNYDLICFLINDLISLHITLKIRKCIGYKLIEYRSDILVIKLYLKSKVIHILKYDKAISKARSGLVQNK